MFLQVHHKIQLKESPQNRILHAADSSNILDEEHPLLVQIASLSLHQKVYLQNHLEYQSFAYLIFPAICISCQYVCSNHTQLQRFSVSEQIFDQAYTNLRAALYQTLILNQIVLIYNLVHQPKSFYQERICVDLVVLYQIFQPIL